MKGVNYRSYRQVEKLINFNDTNLKNYCEDKLKSCDEIIKFIKKKLKRKIRIGMVKFVRLDQVTENSYTD